MGQTLTHGVYLPDEGERNCYAGLAANWQILDTSVGTIAAHTAALAGKAPAVHTHTKSDITDFPAYGNAAGTICEGNDSRLSDARTPVAHTHGKSDVTDLLNSNFIPSANNSYDLGSSSYQWNNLYAKNYYYNGVAWGLNKVNTWSAQQNITGNNSRGSISIYNSAYTKGGTLSVTDLSMGAIYMGDAGQQGLSNSLSFISTDLASNGARTLLSLSAMENTASSGTRTNVVIQYDKNDADNPKKMSVGGALIPNPDATFPLGTSSSRWKSLNGINPGALSLPNINYTDTSKYVDISGGLSTTGSGDWYVPAVDGWVFIIVNNSPTFVNLLVFVTPNGVAPAKFIAGSGGVLEPSSNAMWCGCPAPAGSRVRIRIKNGTIEQAIFVTCQGNV